MGLAAPRYRPRQGLVNTRRYSVRKLLPVVLTGAMAVSFSTLAQDADKTRDNVHYNIHQRGDQNTSQYGSGNLELTRFRGHLNLWKVRESRNAQNKTAVPV